MNYGSAGGQVPVESSWFNNTSKKTRLEKGMIRVFKSSEQNINHSTTAKTLPVLLLAETLTLNNLLQQRSTFNETTLPEGLWWQDAQQTIYATQRRGTSAGQCMGSHLLAGCWFPPLLPKEMAIPEQPCKRWSHESTQSCSPSTLLLLEHTPGRQLVCPRATMVLETPLWAEAGEEWRMLCCLHSHVRRGLTKKPFGILHRCWFCSPTQPADGQEHLFQNKLTLDRNQDERTWAQVTRMSYNYCYDSCLICSLLSLPAHAPQPHMLHEEHHRPISSARHQFSQWSDVLHRAIVHKPLFVEKQTKGEHWKYFYMILFRFLKMWDNE